MLKLEKVSKSRDIHISFRDKQRFLSRNFIYALAIATIIHIMALMTFHIGSLNLLNSEKILPSSLVEADPWMGSEHELENLITAHIKEDILIQPIPPPKRTFPSLPDVPKIHFSKHFEYTKDNHLLPNFFTHIEREIQDLYFVKHDIPEEFTPVEIEVFGSLKERKRIDHLFSTPAIAFLFLPQKNKGGYLKKYRITYAIQIEEKTGQIFWFETKEKREKDAHHLIAERILHNIQFKSNEAQFISSGEIEVVFTEQED